MNYGTQINDIAQAAFSEYQTAEAGLSAAIKQREKYPDVLHKRSDHEYYANVTRAEADYQTAKEAVKSAKKAFESRCNEVGQMRDNLKKDIDKLYGMTASELDANEMELLKSGAMSPADFERMLEVDIGIKNYTMVRMIGKHARDAANARFNKYGDRDDVGMKYWQVAMKCDRIDGSDLLKAFDMLSDLLRRCADNPAMIGYWEQLGGDAIKLLNR